PVADLGGAMKDVIDALNGATQRVGIAKVAAHHLGDPVEEGGIRAGADQRPDAQAAPRAGLGEMTAHKSGGVGNQADGGYEHPWVRASVSLPFPRGEEGEGEGLRRVSRIVLAICVPIDKRQAGEFVQSPWTVYRSPHAPREVATSRGA